MTDSELLTDEYLAELMAREAKTSIKYSAMGFGSTNSKPPANKPKPNTRFLNNIIKETTSHNQALLAKEAAESRARLESLAVPERKRPIGGGDIRRRQLGDIAAILSNGGKKHHRTQDVRFDAKETRKRPNTSSEEDEPTPKKARRNQLDEIRKTLESGNGRSRRDLVHNQVDKYRRESSRNDDAANRLSQKRLDQDVESEGDDRDSRRQDKNERRQRNVSAEEGSKTRSREDSERRHRRRRDDSEDENESRGQRHRHRRHRSRSISNDRRRDREHRKRRYRSRSRSPRKHRDETRNGDRSPIRRPSRRQSPPSTERGEKHALLDHDSDSDPLESIIGPPPPPPVTAVKSRGRGTFSHLSGIDSRFSADYDPNVDVQPSLDDDDWDQALEALRDRQKWKQQGADRLRAAGFTDEEITKWEKGGEKTEEDVVWAKKGEGREWDRGKVIDEESGRVGFESTFGRLKDT